MGSRFELSYGRSEDTIARKEDMMKAKNRIKGVFCL
jgi:hypothetical protein